MSNKKKRKTEDEIIDEIIKGTYTTEKQRKMKLRNANLRKEMTRKDDIAPIKNTEQVKSTAPGGRGKDPTFLESAGHVIKSTGTGILGGLTGIFESGATEIASNLSKGHEEKDKGFLGQAKDFAEATAYILNPAKRLVDAPIKMAKEINEVREDDSKNMLQKLGSALNIATNNALEVILPEKKLVDETIQAVGTKFEDDAGEAVLKGSQEVTKPYYDLAQEVADEGAGYGGFTEKAGQAGQVVGRMFPSIGASMLTRNPQVGLGVMTASVKGSETMSAYNQLEAEQAKLPEEQRKELSSLLDEAIKVGNTKAMIEYGTEMLFGGVNFLGKGAIDDIVSKGINKRVKNEVMNFLAKKGYEVGGEIVEEAIANSLGTIVDSGTVNPDATYGLEELGDDTVITILSTLVLNAITGGYGRRAYRDNVAEMQEYESAIAGKEAELAQSQDQREQEIIRDELDVLQEEASNIPVKDTRTKTEQIEDAKKEATQIVADIERNLELEQQAETVQEQQEIRNRITELEAQLEPLQAQLEAENSDTYSKEIAKLEDLKTKYDNPTVQKLFDKEINKLKQDSRQEEEVAPAGKAEAEVAYKQASESRTDEDVEYQASVEDDRIPVSGDIAVSEDTTDIKTRIKNTFGLKTREADELYEKVAHLDSVEQVREILEDYKDINETYESEEIRSAKKYLRETKINTSNLKTDHKQELMRKARGQVRFNKEGASVDQVYQELSSMHPDLFSDDVVNEADQFERIVDFVTNNKIKNTVKIDEIDKESLNQLAEELYTEVHAEEFEKATGYKDSLNDLDNVVDQEALKAELSDELKKQVNDIKTELKSLKEALAPVKDLSKQVKQVKQDISKEFDRLEEKVTKSNSEKAIDYYVEKFQKLDEAYQNIIENEGRSLEQSVDSYIDKHNLNMTAEEFINRFKNMSVEATDNMTEDQKELLELINRIKEELTYVDSEGRELSEGQKTYFQNSKVRDENGNLLAVYHGTRGDFDVFETSRTGQNYDGDYSSLGRGSYFTDDIEVATDFGEASINEGDLNVKVSYLNIENPFYTEMSKNDSSILAEISKKYGISEDDMYDGYNLIRILKGKGVDTTDLLQRYGYDGIIGDGEFVAFNANQIKDYSNQNPTDSDNIHYSLDDEELFQGRASSGFYSQLENIVNSKMQNTAPANQVLNLIKNNGVKQDELDWTGIEDYLTEKGTEKVTKQEIQDFIKANQLNIKEIRLDESERKRYHEDLEEARLQKVEAQEKLKSFIERIKANNSIPNDVEEDWSLYHDIALAMDTNYTESQDKISQAIDNLNFVYQRLGKIPDVTFKLTNEEALELYDLNYDFLEKDRAYYNFDDNNILKYDLTKDPKYANFTTGFDGGENYREILFTIPEETIAKRGMKEFTASQHWDTDDSVLAHTRLKDYTDIEGNKVLFIEEIQSDLHQAGRKSGYSSPEIIKERQRLNAEKTNLREMIWQKEDRKFKIEHEIQEKFIRKYKDAHAEAFVKQLQITNKYADIEPHSMVSEIDELLESYHRQANQFASAGLPFDDIGRYINPEYGLTYEDVQEYIKVSREMDRYNRFLNDVTLDPDYTYELGQNEEYQKIINEDLTELRKQYNEATDAVIELTKKGYIDSRFPFKNTKDWSGFVLRKVINEAVKQGYDKVAWTTGHQQNRRYDLSNHIDSLVYQYVYDDETYDIAGYKDEKKLFTYTALSENKLEEYVGKEITEKIVNSKTEGGELTGLDLQVGGQAMKDFYDKMIPNYLNKYLKKWNSTVEDVYVGKDLSHTSAYKKGGVEELLKIANKTSSTAIYKQQGFKITPEMRESIAKTGQPLYSLTDEELQSMEDHSEENEIDRLINETMTMEEAKKMLDEAFIYQNVAKWGEYKNADEWLAGDGVDEVSLVVDSIWQLEHYKAPLYDEGLNDSFTLSDIIQAYADGTLRGKQTTNVKRLDLTTDTGFTDDKFYSPKGVTATIETYQKAKQRVTKNNQEEVIKARAEFITNAHNKGFIESLGLTQEQVNKDLKNWSNYNKTAMNISNRFNEGVALQNRWVGIENSSIIKPGTITEEELNNMVKDIHGTSNERDSYYIVSTMLAIDTHINYKGLSFEFDRRNMESMKETALGDYSSLKKLIRIKEDGQNTVAHEIGHYIDNIWGEEIFGYGNLTDRTNLKYIEDPEIKQWVTNFYSFLNKLEHNADMRSDYTITPTEVFARFVARFTEWTRNIGTGNRYQFETKYYNDTFNTSHYVEFVKLLQEKAKLDTTKADKYSLKTRATDRVLDARIDDIFNDLLNDKQMPVKTSENTSKTNVNTTVNKDVVPPTKTPKKANVDPGDGKLRSWAETATESDALEGKISLNDLDIEKITYMPITNKGTLANVDRLLQSKGFDKALEDFNKKFDGSERIKVEDITMGERLMQEANKRGDLETAIDLLEKITILGTEVGQVVQSLSIIQRMTPAGQYKMLKKTIDRAKVRGDKAFESVEITDAMKKKINSAYNKDGKTYDQDKLNRAMEEVKQEIADQLEATTLDKVNAWRYLSMLGNLRTHLRNIVANTAMWGTTKVKDTVARTAETIAPVIAPVKERTKTFKKASKTVTNFANETAEELRSVILSQSKSGELGEIKELARTYETEILEKIYNFNSKWLTKEDWWFSGARFKTTFKEFLTANGINTQEDIDNNVELVEKGKKYAIEQARIATFQQMSTLANALSRYERTSIGANIAVGAILPFKKTPINIAKTGLAYSPIGAIKALFYDMPRVAQGKMEASKAIDNLAQGLTGSALTLVGMFLSMAGILTGSGDDDKEGKYDYQLGNQKYALKIGDNTYALSWLSPVAMPLFIGVNAHEILIEGKEWNANVVIEALGQTLDPLNEMSFISSLTNVLSSYEDGNMALFGMAEAMGQNYVTQFIPTLLSQLAGTIDDTKRSTKVSADSGNTVAEGLKNKIMYKIPLLRNLLEPTIDIWGNEIKQSENLLERAYDNFISPYTRKESIATEIDAEIKDVFAETGNAGVIPNIPTSKVTYKNEEYKMSNKDYTAYKKQYGQTANDLLEDLFRTSSYKKADANEQARMIDNVYTYASDEAKKSYLSKQGVKYTNTTEDNIPIYKENAVKGAIENDMYLDEFKMYRDNPEKYEFFESKGISYEQYESRKEEYDYYYRSPKKYLAGTLIGDFETAKSIMDGINDIKSVDGERRPYVEAYIDSLEGLEPIQKSILLRSEYKSYRDDNNAIVNYVAGTGKSFAEMKEILEALDMNVEEDGTVWWD